MLDSFPGNWVQSQLFCEMSCSLHCSEQRPISAFPLPRKESTEDEKSALLGSALWVMRLHEDSVSPTTCASPPSPLHTWCIRGGAPIYFQSRDFQGLPWLCVSSSLCRTIRERTLQLVLPDKENHRGWLHLLPCSGTNPNRTVCLRVISYQ